MTPEQDVEAGQPRENLSLDEQDLREELRHVGKQFVLNHQRTSWPWGAIAGWLAFLFLVFYFAYERWDGQKALSVALVSSTELVDRSAAAGTDGFRLFVGDQEVPNLTTLVLQLRNEGGVVTAADFEDDVVLELENAEKIVSAHTIRTRPEGIPDPVLHRGKTVRIAPALLNRGDILTIEVRAVPANLTETVQIGQVTGRVAGVHTVKYRKELDEEALRPHWYFLAFLLLALLLTLAVLQRGRVRQLQAQATYIEGKYVEQVVASTRWSKERDSPPQDS